MSSNRTTETRSTQSRSTRSVVIALLVAIAIIVGVPATADYVGTAINRIFLDPRSLQDFTVGDPYYPNLFPNDGSGAGISMDNGDIISFIIETIPDPDANDEQGHAAWSTLYVPNGAEVVDADLVQLNLDGMSYSKILAKDVAPAWNDAGERDFRGYSGYNTGDYNNGAAVPVGNRVLLADSPINEIQSDTGVFFSTDPRTKVVPSTYDGGGMQLTAGYVSVDPTGVVVQIVYNQWDAEQTLAFGRSGTTPTAQAAHVYLTDPAACGGMGEPACVGASLNGGTGNVPLISLNNGTTYKGLGSPVAGPDSYYTNDYQALGLDGMTGSLTCTPAYATDGNTWSMNAFIDNFMAKAQCVGPWRRIAYPNQKVGGPWSFGVEGPGVFNPQNTLVGCGIGCSQSQATNDSVLYRNGSNEPIGFNVWVDTTLGRQGPLPAGVFDFATQECGRASANGILDPGECLGLGDTGGVQGDSQATNTVRFVQGVRNKGDVEHARVTFRITNREAFVASFSPFPVGDVQHDSGIFCLDSIGGDTSSGDPGSASAKDNNWRYYEPKHRCFQRALTQAAITKTPVAVNGMASNAQIVKQNDLVIYRIVFANISGAKLWNVRLFDRPLNDDGSPGNTELDIQNPNGSISALCNPAPFDPTRPASYNTAAQYFHGWTRQAGGMSTLAPTLTSATTSLATWNPVNLEVGEFITAYVCASVKTANAIGDPYVNQARVLYNAECDVGGANCSEIDRELTDGVLSFVGTRISGYVYNDEDRSGHYTNSTNDIPVESMEICLYRDFGTANVLDVADILIECTLTGSDGSYFFDNPPAAGTHGYLIKESLTTYTANGCTKLPDLLTIASGDIDSAGGTPAANPPVGATQCRTVGGSSQSGTSTATQNCSMIDPVLVSGSSAGNNFFIACAESLPVVLSAFHADPNGIIEWTTATESGNAGFNLVQQTSSGSHQLNPEIIPSREVDSTRPLRYRYDAGSVDPDAVVFVEDVDIFGGVQREGPYEVGRRYGSNLMALSSERTASTDLLGAPNWDAVARERAAKDVAPPARRWGKMTIGVNETGIQRISYEDLYAAGLDLGGRRSDEIAIWQNDVLVPVYVGGPKKFGPGSWIEFHGEGLDSLYTNTRVYVLAVSRRALQMPVDDVPPPTSKKVSKYYLETLTVNRNLAYQAASPTGDPWFDTQVFAFGSPDSADIPFLVDHYFSNGPKPRIKAKMYGLTDFPDTDDDHHIRGALNGQVLVDRRLSGQQVLSFKKRVANSLLNNGLNTFTMELPGDVEALFDISVFDQLELTYPRRPFAQDGRLDFSAKGSIQKVRGFKSNSVVAYRFDGDTPVRVAANVVPESGKYSAYLKGYRKGSRHRYVVSEAGKLFKPSLRRQEGDDSLLDDQAQYLIISHRDFLEDLGDLVSHRESQGWQTKIVDVDDVYREFGDGSIDPFAIQRFVRYAAENLGMEMVLLVGGDSYDYHDYLELGSYSFIPSLYVKTAPTVNFSPADPLYTDIDGDGYPDRPIGRLPVRTSGELQTIIDKILTYDQNALPPAALFANDVSTADVGESFYDSSVGFAADLGPSWSVKSVNLGNLGVSESRAQIVAGIEDGAALTSFFGHSGPSAWSFVGLFDLNHVAALNNEGLPTVVTQWGCWNTYYVDPTQLTMSHSFMLSGENGAAAVMGAASLTSVASDRALGREFMPRLGVQGATIGQALQDAKAAMVDQGRLLDDVLLGWTLLGDPATVIHP